MMHHRRRFAVKDYTDAQVLARDLVTMSWTLCTGFRFQGLLFLNDATSEDGAFEVAVIEEKSGRQIESVTFGWFVERGPDARASEEAGIAKAVESIQMCIELAKKPGDDYRTGWGAVKDWRPRIEPAENHECDLCR
jgi:hypothetical protein